MGIEQQHITQLETEIKELNRDLKQEKEKVQALYNEVKTQKNKIESILKNHDIVRDEWQLDMLKKDAELNNMKKKLCKCPNDKK
tara:strand:+ start:2498 stop:2749 length:252 start_codon:yes stop_codon:yes gene_type:complete